MAKKSQSPDIQAQQDLIVEKFEQTLWTLQTGSGIRSAEVPSTTLRGGNAGCVIKNKGDTTIVGNCPRLAHLRTKRTQADIDPRTMLLFEGGLSNEDHVANLLEGAGYYLRREEEIPVRWTTVSGMEVTGRPDIVIMDRDDTPVLGLELKQVASVWTARDVLLKNLPKTEHVIQAAHYSMCLGVPFQLLYTSRVHFEIPWRDWFHKEAKGHPAVEEREGVPAKILPFHTSYGLDWDKAGQLFLTCPDGDRRTTPITQDGIRRYYNNTAEMERDNDLGPRPIGINVWGEPSKKGPCTWCEFSDVCDSPELTYSEFMARTLQGDSNE